MLVLNLTLKDFIKRESRGRKPKFPPEKEEDFKIELDNMQVSFKGGSITAKNIQPLLTDKFDYNDSDSGFDTFFLDEV